MNNKKRKKAIGINYNKEVKNNPYTVVASGKGRLAELIIKKAKEEKIPIHEDPDLVEMLTELEIEDEIQPKLYKTIAEIFILIYENCK